LDKLAVTDEQHAATRDLLSVFTYQGLDYHLHPHLVLPGKVESGNESTPPEPEVVLCFDCAGKLSAKKPCIPKYFIANSWDFGRLQHMPPLSALEKVMIAKVVCFGSIVKLKEQRNGSQQALSGQIIAFPDNGAEMAAAMAERLTKTSFPFHTNEDLLQFF
jgi:hypothetical protein